MKRFTIVIGREFGCNAQEIARLVSEKMGVHFYDHELVSLAAQKAGISSDYYVQLNENPPMTDNFFNKFIYGATASFYSEKAIEAQAAVIREIAGRESSVMLGRCADYFLTEFENILNVFVYAPLPYRVSHIAESYQMTEREAEKMISKIDGKRHAYYRFVTGHDRGDRHGRNLMLDAEMFGIQGVASLICSAVKMKFNPDTNNNNNP